jgi:hypothetical protein
MGRLSFICDLGYVVLSLLHAGVGDFLYGLLSCDLGLIARHLS